MEQDEQKRETPQSARGDVEERKQLLNEERYRLSEARDFWSECVSCLLNGGAGRSGVLLQLPNDDGK